MAFNHPIIQSSNHSSIQSSNHPIIQSSNHPIIQASKQAIKQSSNQTIKQSNNQTIKQSNNQTIKQSSNQASNQATLPYCYNFYNNPLKNPLLFIVPLSINPRNIFEPFDSISPIFTSVGLTELNSKEK
ncbi:hypothetical protein [Helicobacter pylori]|uniref:hypothetical protein n=1 Tax=Helicobacter pylori TaxID=210 RepID=UPI001E45B5A6|nr:hypothetical protein [Helicobacter pylori]